MKLYFIFIITLTVVIKTSECIEKCQPVLKCNPRDCKRCDSNEFPLLQRCKCCPTCIPNNNCLTPKNCASVVCPLVNCITGSTSYTPKCRCCPTCGPVKSLT